MTGRLHLEPLLATGYAVVLLVIALGLEWFGRYSHRRSGQFRTAGFKYHHQLDVWECPTGHHLHPHSHDAARRARRYRAPAHTCNACAMKIHCTDSDHGREILHSSVSWSESEAGRFHRGISLVLVVLAAFILTVELFRAHGGPDLLLLGAGLGLIGSIGLKLARERFRPSQPAPGLPTSARHSFWS